MEEGTILDCVHIQMELLVLPSIAHEVAFVRSDHNVLEFLVWWIVYLIYLLSFLEIITWKGY